MLLGGTVSGKYSGPEEWEQLLIRSRFKAVTAPFNMYTPRKETEAYLDICDRHGVMIAEIGVWKNLFDPVPTFTYGLVMFLTAISFFLLRKAIVKQDECSHILQEAMENDRRGTITGIVYIVAMGLSFVLPQMAFVLYTALLLLWFMPDKNIEQAVYNSDRDNDGPRE